MPRQFRQQLEFSGVFSQLAERTRPAFRYSTSPDVEPKRLAVDAEDRVFVHPDDVEAFEQGVYVAGWKAVKTR